MLQTDCPCPQRSCLLTACCLAASPSPLQAGEKRQCSKAWNSFRRPVNPCTPTSSYHSAINQMVWFAPTLFVAYKYRAIGIRSVTSAMPLHNAPVASTPKMTLQTVLWHTGIKFLVYRHQVSGGHEGRCENGSQAVSCNSWSSESSGSQPQVRCNRTRSPQTSPSLTNQSA